jgi:hypothetical protein
MSTPCLHLDLVVFHWGRLVLALQAQQVAGLAAAADPAIPSIGALLGVAAGGTGAMRLLRLAAPAGPAAVRVEEPVRQVRLPAAALRPLPPLLAARLRLPCIRALARSDTPDGAPIVVLDAQYLTNSAAAECTTPGSVSG